MENKNNEELELKDEKESLDNSNENNKVENENVVTEKEDVKVVYVDSRENVSIPNVIRDEDKKPEVEEKTTGKKVLDFFITTLNGMAIGLFATLIQLENSSQRIHLCIQYLLMVQLHFSF